MQNILNRKERKVCSKFTKESLRPSRNPLRPLRLRTLWISAIVSFLVIIQANGQVTKTSIKVMSRALSDSILLRWAPNNFEGWNAGNNYGYNIVRFMLMRNGELISNPTPEKLTPDPIKPWPLQNWDKLIDNDDYAAVAAQAIYGETFKLTTTKSTSVFDIVNKVKEQDSRFSFALFVADMSPMAAKASGLWFTDRNVKKGEKYLYRINLAAPATIVVSDTGFAYTGTDEHLYLPKPLELRAEFGDKGVILHWERKTFDYLYNSYSVERSEDGNNFVKINKQPVVYTISADFDETNELLYIDSLAANDKLYYYRIIGHTSFGEQSPPSEIVSGNGVVDVKVIPEIKEDYETNGQVYLKWIYPVDEEKNIFGFKVLRASEYKSAYDTISVLLDPVKREFSDTKPMNVNYYKIAACGKNGHSKASVPSMVQLVDSIPPAPPVGLKAIADTTGRLVLSWKPNTEIDMYGYRVYRANAANEEYSQITVAPVRDTMFVDTINLKTLTINIYYQLMAIDKRQNHSQFSEPLEVERPDVVPPAPPVIKNIKSAYNGVVIDWIASNSNDVVKHVLLRKEKGTNTYNTLAEISISDTNRTITDTTAITNQVYYYSIVAMDKSGLKSMPSAELAGQKILNFSEKGLGTIKYKTDRKNFRIILSWDVPAGKVKQYIIYRKAGESGVLTVYTRILGNNQEFTDMQVKADTKFTYLVRAIMEDESGIMSEKVDIDY